jgi:peptidyl-prolyl cis-trans isomerase SurA
MFKIKNLIKLLYPTSKALVAVLALLLMGTPITVSNAQQVLQRIEAMVNDDIISGYDLSQRMGLVLAATGGVQDQNELDRMQEQVLRSLVDEHLQLQEAKEFELEIEDSEIEGAFERIAQNFQQTPEEFEVFLVQSGSSKASLFAQLRAEFAWQELVNGRLGSQVVISEEDVEAQLQRIQDNVGKYEYRVAEIYLILDNPTHSALVLQTANRIKSQLDQGAQFFSLARQFSESASAARGGDMGWVSEGQMAPEIETVVSTMEVGELSPPIRAAGGYYIITLVDRRRILGIDPMDTILDIYQFRHAFTNETTQQDAEAWLVHSEQALAGMNGCDQVDNIAAALGEVTHGSSGQLPLRQLNAQLRQVLSPLEIGQPSEPIITEEGIIVFLVCGRTQPEVHMPTFDEIMGQLEQQRLAMMSRRYLRDLRRDAIVDYR